MKTTHVKNIENLYIGEKSNFFSDPSCGEQPKKSGLRPNHLGNVHLVLSDRKQTSTYDNTLAAYEYYPFGMAMQTYETDAYRYGFNGMEKDDDWSGSGNSYDFGARIYDSRLGRWLSLDPLKSDYPSFTPYVFVANSPILLVDIDGRKWKKGEIKGSFSTDEQLLKPKLNEPADANITLEHTYVMKLHIDLPTGDSGGEDWTGSAFSPNTGHTFAQLVRTTIRTVNGKSETITEEVFAGFHPETQSLWSSVNGYMSNETGYLNSENKSTADVIVEKNINKQQFDLAIIWLEAVVSTTETGEQKYHTGSFNCTTVGIYTAYMAGMEVPVTIKAYAAGTVIGVTPSQLGKDLLDMTEEEKKEKGIKVTQSKDSKEEPTGSADEGGSSNED